MNRFTRKLHQWSMSNFLTVNKSRFKGFCIPISNNFEIKDLLKELPQLEKKLEKASHPTMYAWKTADSLSINDNKKNRNTVKTKNYNQKENLIVSKDILVKKLTGLNQGFNDDNEGGSGLRLLGLLDRLKIMNVLVVASRWYGGVPLGPARFKCISDVAHEALRNGGYLNIKPQNGYWIDATKIVNK